MLTTITQLLFYSSIIIITFNLDNWLQYIFIIIIFHYNKFCDIILIFCFRLVYENALLALPLFVPKRFELILSFCVILLKEKTTLKREAAIEIKSTINIFIIK